MAQQKKAPMQTGWVGWIYFGGALLLALGGLQIIAGLVGIFRNDFYVATTNSLLAFNYTTWGWIYLILGIVVMLTGIGIWTGQTWARIVAIFLAVLSITGHTAFITAYPLWSIIAIVLCGFIIYALALHGDETKVT